MPSISDADLTVVRRLVKEQRAVPALIVEAILDRLALAEARRAAQMSSDQQQLSLEQ
jgi:hypothetical protein